MRKERKGDLRLEREKKIREGDIRLCEWEKKR